MTVDILCAVLDGERFLPDFLRSLDGQTHADWRLWARDDGSSDSSVEILRAKAASDQRVHVLETPGDRRLGATAAFARLLDAAPQDARYLMFADQDDIWLPGKIERSLRAVRTAEADGEGPVLVHTDLTVVDEALNPIHPSFWAFAALDPEPVSLRRMTVQNVVTGATAMFNGPLRLLAAPIPPRAALHDWWMACVAAAFGKIVPIKEPTILYRQHGRNAVGARDARITIGGLPAAISDAMASGPLFRKVLRQSAEQAGAFLERYGDRLPEADRLFLLQYSRIPDRGFFRRKLDVLRLRALPDRGLLGALGAVIRG